jgi:hypothetical protein
MDRKYKVGDVVWLVSVTKDYGRLHGAGADIIRVGCIRHNRPSYAIKLKGGLREELVRVNELNLILA